MKKFNLYVLIVLISFGIIISIFIFYTAWCNENAVFTGAGVSKNKTIILDAGHGGFDGGTASSDGTIEKDINLQITLKIKALLELYGYDIIMTRTDDSSIHDKDAQSIRQQKVTDIRNREKIIKENPNSLFVSIHQNFFADSSVHGAQVFYSKNNTSSSVLAQSISDAIASHIQPDNKRKIKKSGTEIYLLYHSTVPSVMVECGFMSNYNDLTNLKNENYQMKLAMAIVDGITNYYKG